MWLQGLHVCTVCLPSAPVASALSARYSHRSVVMMGGLIGSVGVMIGSFVHGLIELYLLLGFVAGKCVMQTHMNTEQITVILSFITGFGYALTWTPTVTMLGLYFERRRPVANSLASAGECIFTFVLTPLFQLLIDRYSWRGAMLILGGLQLNLCVCGMLLRPLKATRDAKVVERLLEKEDLQGQMDACIKNEPKDPDVKTESTVQISTSKAKRAALKASILRYVDYTLITNAPFMVYSMFGVFAALGFFAPGLFLVPYARSKGIEEYQSAALMSISAVLDVFGRVFFGWVANMRLVKMVSSMKCMFTAVVLKN